MTTEQIIAYFNGYIAGLVADLNEGYGVGFSCSKEWLPGRVSFVLELRDGRTIQILAQEVTQ